MIPKGLTAALRVSVVLIGAAALGLLLISVSDASASDEVSRIRERFDEMNSRILSEWYSSAGEGRESNANRVYRDYAYLLMASKTDALKEGLMKASSPERAEILQKAHDYLMLHRIYGEISQSLDNMRRFERNNQIQMAGSSTALTLRSFPTMLANETDRSNRRNWYLASRELLDAANVLLFSLRVDFDRFSRELAGKPGRDYLVDFYELDLGLMSEIADAVLESTREEFEALLTELTSSQLGMEFRELRAYDVPHLLRFPALDRSFPKGKMEDSANKWMRSLDINMGRQRYLRIYADDRAGKDPTPRTFPISNERNTRISIATQDGFPDYVNLFAQLGEAQFYYHISPELPFEHRAVGSPLLPQSYGQLFRRVLSQPEWRDEYLSIRDEDAELASKAFRLSELHDLRMAAGRHQWQVFRRENPDAPPTAYNEIMQAAMLWPFGSSEMPEHLVADDDLASGTFLVAYLLATQLEEKLVSEFGPQWYSNSKAGNWLRNQWARGFTVSAPDLPKSWGLDGPDPGVLLSAVQNADGEVEPLTPDATGD